MQTDIQHKITRLIYELNELDKGAVNLKKLAAELGVSVRTLQRDMNTLQEAQFPLYNPAAGSYAFTEGYSLEKMKLSGAEASLLVIMSELAASLGDKFSDSFKLLKQRLLQMPEENSFFIKVSGGETYPDTPLTRTLEQCVRAHEKAVICYQSGKRACYPARPLKLLWMEGFWYLLALMDNNKLLKFRLEKITSVTPKGEFFKYDKNIENILHQSTNIWFEPHRPLVVKLEVSAGCAKYFKSKVYFPLQKTIQQRKDGRLIISCQAAKTAEIVPTILHWLPHIRVISPQSLRNEIYAILKDYLKA